MRATLLAALLALLLAACGGSAPPVGPGDGGAADAAADEGGMPGEGGVPGDGGAVGDGAPGDDGAPLGDGGCDPTTVTPPAGCPGDTFTPDSPVEDWRHTGSSVIAALGDPHHRCIDMIYNPGQPQILIGKFAYGTLDTDLTDENVEVWARRACGTWEKLGAFLTSDDNDYGTVEGVADDGGRVFFTVPAGQGLPAGTYPIKMLVKGDHTSADCTLAVWPAGTHAVVSDIDGTITTSEYDGVWTAFLPSSPDPHPSVAAMYQQYVRKDYRVVYLTARPEFLTSGTRGWFADHGFPDGLFHLSQTTFGESGSAAIDYKAGWLQDRIDKQGIVFDYAYGNKDTDLAAYTQVGVPADAVYLMLYDGELQGAHRLDDYGTEVPRVACLPPAAQP